MRGPGLPRPTEGTAFLPSHTSSSQPGLTVVHLTARPRCLPSPQTSRTPQASAHDKIHAGAPCQPLRLAHTIPQTPPCKTRGGSGLPEPAQHCCTFFSHQQKPATHSRYILLTSSQSSKHLHSKHSPLDFSSILCQPSPATQPPGFGPPLGRGCLSKSKLVTSGVVFTDVQIQSPHLATCQVVEHKALPLRVAGCIWWEGRGVSARRHEATVRAERRTVSSPHGRGGLNHEDQRQTWLLRKA